MSISAIDDRHCSRCRTPISDPTSRALRLGPECRRGMTPDQLRSVLKRNAEAADPFRIPEQRAPSAAALHRRAKLRATLEQAAAPETARCHHDGIPGQCPMCREEADPHRASLRIIREVKKERREHGYDLLTGMRLAAFLAFCRRPIGRTPPPVRQRRPATPATAPAAQQLALEAS